MARSKKHYYYVDSAKQQKHGLMNCCKCGRKIVEGAYRYHETADAYVSCHRACCPDDPEWARRDAAEAEAQRYQAEYRQACKDFVAKWGVPDEEDFCNLG